MKIPNSIWIVFFNDGGQGKGSAIFCATKTKQEAVQAKQSYPKLGTSKPVKFLSPNGLNLFIKNGKFVRHLTHEEELKELNKTAKKILRSKKSAREFIKKIRIPKSAFKGE